MNTLAAIITTDRDKELYKNLHSALEHNLSAADEILVVTRKTDVATIDFWRFRAKVVTVPHYEIGDRHNWEYLTLKRNIAIKYAQDNHCDLWFVDSDVVPNMDILSIMKKSSADIVIAPYKPKWYHMACVGIITNNTPQITLVENLFPVEYHKCHIGGFGCTLIKNRALDVRAEYKSIDGGIRQVYGEDIGYFVKCYELGLSCEYVTVVQRHLCE